jgi:hypothetical protein
MLSFYNEKCRKDINEKSISTCRDEKKAYLHVKQENIHKKMQISLPS